MTDMDRSINYVDFGTKLVNYFWWTGLKNAESFISIHLEPLEINRLIKKMITGLQTIDALPKVFGEWPLEPFTANDSELNEKYYENKKSYIRTLTKAAIDHTPEVWENTITPLATQNVTIDNPTPCERWFFINGICTSADMAKVNAQMLSKLFQRPITPLHNPTNGMMADLLEAMGERTLNQITAISDSTQQFIWQELKQLEARIAQAEAESRNSFKVVIIAHSQGGIIAANAVGKLLQEHGDDPLLRNHLEVYTFASAHDEYPSPYTSHLQHQKPYSEHFANDDDYVAINGVLSHTTHTAGKIYRNKRAGHLLNYHYLRDFSLNQFEDQEHSRLHTLLNGNR